MQDSACCNTTDDTLRTSDGFFRALFDNANIGIAISSPEKSFLQVNRHLCELFGYSEDELRRKTWAELTHPQDVGEDLAQFEEMLSGRIDVYEMDKRFLRKDGAVLWTHLTVSCLRGPDRTVQFVIASIQDVTERVRTETALRQSERSLRSLIENSLVGVAIVDEQGIVVEWNAAAERISAVPSAEAIGRSLWDVTIRLAPPERRTEEARARFAASIREALRTGQAAFCGPSEFTHVRATGERVTTRHVAFPIKTAEGYRFAAIIEDVTLQKSAEQALRLSEQNYREIFNAVSDAIFIHDESGRVVDVNDRGCAMFGCDRETMSRLSFNDFSLGHPPYSEAEAVERIRRAVNEGPQVFEWQSRLYDGELFWSEVALRVCNLQGERRVIASVRDLTDRKRTQEELSNSQRILQTVLDHVPDVVFWKDKDSVYLGCNKRFAADAGVASPQEIVGKRDSDLPWSGVHAERMVAVDRSVMECGRPRLGYEEQESIADGRTLWFRKNKVPLRGSDGSTIGVLGTAEDITEQKLADAALLESEAKFRGIAERSFDIIYLIDPNGRVTYVSPAIERVLGFAQAEVVGRHFGSLVTADDLPTVLSAFARHLQGIETGVYQVRLKHASGHSVFVEINAHQVLADGQVSGVQGIIRDLTARLRIEEKLHRAEEQLSHMARLSTLGELIASIAHELNQPLYAIQNVAKACRNVLSNRPLQDTDEVCDWCNDIAETAARAGAVVKNLREYSRRTGSGRAAAPLCEILDESVKLLAYAARRHGAVIELDLDEPSTIVDVDRIQIQQVLVNLLRNACEAMAAEEIKRRQVTVRSRVMDDEVEIRVEDTGPGLPVELGMKIFDPFVTTKPDGLGLGLSICTTIVEAHGGKLKAFSNPHGGATFQFKLPADRRDSCHVP